VNGSAQRREARMIVENANVRLNTQPNCPLQTGLRPCECDLPRCPVCNYTDHDARFECDHWHCGGAIPPSCPKCHRPHRLTKHGAECGACMDPEHFSTHFCGHDGCGHAWKQKRKANASNE